MDGLGEQVDFTQAIIILTTNAGSQTIQETHEDINQQKLTEALSQVFPLALLGRLQVIAFDCLHDKTLINIARRCCQELQTALHAKYPITLSLSKPCIEHLISQSDTQRFGARPLEQNFNQLITPLVTEHLLAQDKSITTATTTDGPVRSVLDDSLASKIAVLRFARMDKSEQDAWHRTFSPPSTARWLPAPVAGSGPWTLPAHSN